MEKAGLEIRPSEASMPPACLPVVLNFFDTPTDTFLKNFYFDFINVDVPERPNGMDDFWKPKISPSLGRFGRRV